jgi:hypothetical protein
MKLGFGVLVMVSFVCATANAKIVNLPKELKGAASSIEQTTNDAVEQFYGCKLTAPESKDLVASYVLTNGVEQDKDYAEYPGELSSFVMIASGTLPKSKCDSAGAFKCTMTFNLYDEKAYEIDDKSTVTCE